MLTFLFWNLRGKPLQNQIATLVREHDIDVLIFAEYNIQDAALLTTVNQDLLNKYEIVFPDFSEKIRIFSRLPHDSIKAVIDEGGISIRSIKTPITNEILLVAVHLSSKLYQTERDQAFLAARVSRLISNAETDIEHSNTLIVGDFNMNPFEDGIIAADAFHAVMSKNIALRKTRKVDGIARKFFYNPMWSRFGDMSLGPPGTYFYNTGRQINYFWNIFDQVLLRPDLLPYFKDENLQVVTIIGETSLLKANGQPNLSLFSDHLPILLRLSI